MSECICGEINARNCPAHQMSEFDAPDEFVADEAGLDSVAFIAGARWQFDQLKAALERENYDERCKTHPKTLIHQSFG